MSLSQRLFAFAVLALLPVFAVVWLLEHQLAADRRREVRDHVFRQTQQASSEIERLIEGQRTLLLALAAAPVVRTGDVDGCLGYVAALKRGLPQIAALFVLDPEGRPWCADRDVVAATGYGDQPYFRETLATGGFVVGDYVAATATGRAALPMAAPVRGDDGRIASVAVAALDLAHLQAIVDRWALPTGGSLTIADRSGLILARNPLPERFVGTAIPADFVKRWVHGDAPGVEEVTSQDGTRRIIAYRPATLRPEGLYVSSGYARDQAFAALDHSFGWNAAVVMAGLAGAVATSWFAARRLIQRPVSDLVSLARSWSRGEGGQGIRRPLPTAEFEAVATALDDMGRAILDRTEAAARQKDLLVRELHHRVKNLLALVQAIGTQTAVSVGAPPAFAERYGERLEAIGRTTDLLTRRNWDDLMLEDLVQAEIDVTPRRERVEIGGPVVRLGPELAMPITLVLHELATNAVKYGALSSGQSHGELEVIWTVADEEEGPVLDLVWRERCADPVAPAVGSGFGSRLIRRTVDQIGTGGSELTAAGLNFRMRVPLKPKAA